MSVSAFVIPQIREIDPFWGLLNDSNLTACSLNLRVCRIIPSGSVTTPPSSKTVLLNRSRAGHMPGMCETHSENKVDY